MKVQYACRWYTLRLCCFVSCDVFHFESRRQSTCSCVTYEGCIVSLWKSLQCRSLLFFEWNKRIYSDVTEAKAARWTSWGTIIALFNWTVVFLWTLWSAGRHTSTTAIEIQLAPYVSNSFCLNKWNLSPANLSFFFLHRIVNHCKVTQESSLSARKF